jgi:hypothetical protein
MKNNPKIQIVVFNIIAFCVLILLIFLAVRDYRAHPHRRAYFNGKAYEFAVDITKVPITYTTVVDKGRLSAQHDIAPEVVGAPEPSRVGKILASVSGFFLTKKSVIKAMC